MAGRPGEIEGFHDGGGAQGTDGRARAGRRGRNPWRIVLAVSLAVFAASLAALGAIAFSYMQGQQKYGGIAESVSEPEEGGLAPFSVDWDALRAVNPDVVAWVYIPGTNVNYPVVRGTDNEYYLTHDFERAEGWLAQYGAVFMDYRNDPDWHDEGYFFYGHHMNDGSMFADIASLADQARFDQCRTVYLLAPQGDFKLRSFSLVNCAASEPIVQTTFATPGELSGYVQSMMDRSVVAVEGAPRADGIGRFFAFATCDEGSDGRYVLYAYAEDSDVGGADSARLSG